MHHLKTSKPPTFERLMVDVNDFASRRLPRRLSRTSSPELAVAWTTEVQSPKSGYTADIRMGPVPSGTIPDCGFPRQHSSLNSRPTKEFTSFK